MKHLYYIAALAATFLTAMPLHAQEEAENDATQQQQTRRRSPQASRGERNDKKDTGLPELTVRAQDMNERLTQEIGNARWMRIIYRQVDLMKEQNAPLYYPTRPMNGQMNLFSVIFQLLGENKIKAYEYLDGYEEFDEAHLINFFRSILDAVHPLRPFHLICGFQFFVHPLTFSHLLGKQLQLFLCLCISVRQIGV